MKRNRIIDLLRRKYPDGDWRWDPEHRVWNDTLSTRRVRAESALRGCCQDPCDHSRVQYRMHMEFYGPRKDDLSWFPDYSEIVLTSIRDFFL